MKKYKIGFVSSAFDLLHAGHIIMLKDAKSVCKRLFVGLHIDPSIERPEKNKPIETVVERKTKLWAIRYIDGIFEYNTEEDLLKLIKMIKPDVRILGDDWWGKPFTGKELDIPIYWHARKYHNLSSTELRQRIINSEKKKLKEISYMSNSADKNALI